MKTFLLDMLADFKAMPWDAKLASIFALLLALTFIVAALMALIAAPWPIELAVGGAGLLIWVTGRLIYWDVFRQ
jgi:hypothetical protein